MPTYSAILLPVRRYRSMGTIILLNSKVNRDVMHDRVTVTSLLRGAVAVWPEMRLHALRRAPVGLPLSHYLVSPGLRTSLQPPLSDRTEQTACAKLCARALATQAELTPGEHTIIEQARKHENVIKEIDTANRRITYAPAIDTKRHEKKLTSEEIRRAFLLVDLVNKRGWQPEQITLEKKYGIGSGIGFLDVLL